MGADHKEGTDPPGGRARCLWVHANPHVQSCRRRRSDRLVASGNTSGNTQQCTQACVPTWEPRAIADRPQGTTEQSRFTCGVAGYARRCLILQECVLAFCSIWNMAASHWRLCSTYKPGMNEQGEDKESSAVLEAVTKQVCIQQKNYACYQHTLFAIASSDYCCCVKLLEVAPCQCNKCYYVLPMVLALQSVVTNEHLKCRSI